MINFFSTIINIFKQTLIWFSKHTHIWLLQFQAFAFEMKMLGYLLLPKESTWRSTSKPHPSESDDHNSINCLLYFITYLYTLFLFQKSLNVQKIEILMKFFILSYFSINPTQPGIFPIFYVIFEFVYQQTR